MALSDFNLSYWLQCTSEFLSTSHFSPREKNNDAKFVDVNSYAHTVDN